MQLALTHLDLPGLRARRRGDRRAGHHRPLPRRGRRRGHPGRHPTDGAVGRGPRAPPPGCCSRPPRPSLGRLFTADPHVRDLLVPVLLVAAVAQPVAGIVFVLDGVLIGAGDGGLPRLGAGWPRWRVFAPRRTSCGRWRAAGAGLALGRLRRPVHGRARGGAAHPRPRRRWMRLGAEGRAGGTTLRRVAVGTAAAAVLPRSSGSTFGSPLQKIAMGLVIVFLTAAFPAHPSPRGRSTTRCPTRSAGCSCSPGRRRWPGPSRPSDRRAGSPRSRAWSACRCGSRSCTTGSTRRASGSPRCRRSSSASGSPARSASRARRQDPRRRLRGQAVRPAGLGLRRCRRAARAHLRRRRRRSWSRTTVLVSTVVDLAFVYYLFRVHRRTWLGGPGPLEIHPTQRAGPGRMGRTVT